MPSRFREFVRRLFPSKKAISIRSCDRSKNRFILRAEILEDRTVPAFVTQTGFFNLTIDLDTAGETVSLYSDSNSNIQFAVSGGTFVFSGGAPSPSNTFGFGPVSGAVNIFITDSAANTAVVFADSGSFTNPTRITATLDDPGAGTITFNGNTTFVGTGGVTASTSRNIVVSSGAVLAAAGGNVSLSANQQANPTSGGFAGVLVNGTVQTVNGNITLEGRGGDASGGQQFGVYLPGGTVQATGTGKVSVTGQGGTNTGGFNGGVALAFGGKIVGGTSGANSVIGTGGASDGSQNDGVFAQDATSVITTNGGNLTVTGNGGGTSGSSSNRGVILATGASIAAGGTGSVTVQGTGGTGIGNNTGVALNNAGSAITSSGGAVSVTGAANSGNNAVEINSGTTLSSGSNASVTITADSLVVDTSATPGTVSAGTGSLTIRSRTAGTRVNFGGDDVLNGSPLTLGISAAEFARLTAGTLVIGRNDIATGSLTVSSDLSRSTATNIQLVSGGDIIQNSAAGSINTGGGALSFSPGAASSYKPNRSGTDATASTVSFASGGDLNINIAGINVDSQYTRLTVAGAVSLNGVDLLLTGGYVPNTNEVFTIVSATSVTGTFNGYANDSVITLNGKTLRVNYTATSVTLTTIGAPTANLQSVTVGQDGTNFPITLTGSDPNTSPVLTLTFIVTEQPAHGTLSGSGANLTYTPDAGYSGPDSFKFKTNNGFLDSTEVTVSITVAEAPAVGDLAPTAWTVNQSGFTGSLAITGGTPGYTITNQTGLPPGLTPVVNGAGTAIVFTGSPTSTGAFNGSVTLKDANGAVVTRTFTITINSALALTNLTTTTWTVGRAGFTGTLTLSGGTPTSTVTTQTGLPPGLTAVLTANTISFTGVTTAAGSFKGSVTVTDGSGAQVTQTFTIVISAAPKFTLAANALPKYTVGTAYSRAIPVTGGTGALTLGVVSLSAPLPTGMTLRVSGSTFILSGTPRVLRTPIRITLIATDSTGAQTTIVYTLTGQQNPVRRGL